GGYKGSALVKDESRGVVAQLAPIGPDISRGRAFFTPVADTRTERAQKTSGAVSEDAAPAPLGRAADLPRHVTSVLKLLVVSACSLLVTDQLLQFVDLITEARIARDHALDLAYGVQHRRVVAIAEAAADLR